MSQAHPSDDDFAALSSFLDQFGFSDRRTSVQDSRLLGRTTVFEYSAPRTGRQLTITYFPGSSKYPRTFTVVIGAGSRSFLLSDFLKLNKRQDLNTAFTTSDLGSDEAAFITNAIAVLRELCETDLRPVISGKSWIDVPFDWKGTR